LPANRRRRNVTRHSKLAIGVLGMAVALIVVGVVVPTAHADAGPGRISALGLTIIVLLVLALGIVLGGSLKRKV
jgi:hypothetical protein